MITQLGTTPQITKIRKNSVEFYKKLKDITGQDTSFRQTGTINIATTKARYQEYLRQKSMSKLFDIDIPVCLWNIAHVITFVILSHVISARSLYDHTKLLLVGIIWYIIERSFSKPDRIHDCTTIDNVYKNTSKPRYDDIFFNTFGQIIYIISKLPMK